ncbi:sensor histidine kinase [Rhodoferax sediminis]|nr:ATP-binding protein [Rhodoferax sediminis]
MTLTAWCRKRSRFDLALALALAALAVNLGLSRYAGGAAAGTPSTFWLDISYQWCVAAVVFFLLQSASIEREWLYWLCLSQALVGTVVLGGMGLHGLRSLQGRIPLFQAWQILNVGFFLLLAAGICYFVARRGGPHRWFVMGTTLLGLGIALNDVLHAETLQTGTAFGHYLYPAFLLLVWLVMTGRGTDSHSAIDAQQTGHLQALSRLRAEQASHSDLLSRRAIESERKRIASDLHDGVGSQLVNLIATLDPHSPQQQAMAIALEQCLLDLKIMVDSIDGEHDSIIDALARLRYRVQPSLDRLGIHMAWSMQDTGELALVTPDQVLQLLRISQEALSNVMRHSRASAVEVTCRYLPYSQCLLLEICDNGRGIQAAMADRRGTGKGLSGMRQRAESIGASIEFSRCQGDRMGTRIMLLLPVSAQTDPHGAGAPATRGPVRPLSDMA